MADRESERILALLKEIDQRPGKTVTAKEKIVLELVTNLNLSDNSLSSVPESIGELKNLTSLNLSYNSLSSVPESIGELKNLTSLDLGFNNLSSVPESIGELKNLTRLDLSSNSLSSVPENIGELKNLTRLDLSSNSLSSVPEHIVELKNLNYLDLNSNSLSSVPERIVELKNLTNLYLDSNSLSSVPENIGELKNLIYLGLNSNSLSSVPESMVELKNLKGMDLSSNNLSSVPESIVELKNLRELYLSENSLSSVPESIVELKKLKRLGLSRLELDRMPRFAVDLNLEFKDETWDFEDGIYIKDLKLKNQPIDMFLQNDRVLIEDWYRSHQTGQTLILNEAKVVFLGDGDVGKTYSIKRLMRDGEKETPENETYFKTTMTHGIIIEKKKENMEDGRKVLLRYWDFGGQTIMHSMHRCFLTENTCYVVMINTRNDRDQMTQARYWLRNVESFAKDAPVILMVNQWGSLVDGIDKKRLHEEFSILKQVLVVNAKDAEPEEFLKLRTAILRQIQEMRSFGEEWPISWNNVRNEITRLAEKEKKFLIPQDEYQQICDRFEVKSEEPEKSEELQAGLLERFNWLGICFSYHRNYQKQILKQYKVLNPEWLTNAIYLIIMNGQECAPKGILPFKVIRLLLNDPEKGESGNVDYLQGITYGKEECEYILEIMRKFSLSYETPTGEFIPALCSEERPENLISSMWNPSTPNKDHVTYILRYQYKPDTIIQRLMVYCKRNDIPVEAWKNGMRVEYKVFGLSIIVDAGKNEQDIIFDVYSIDKGNGYKAGTYLLLQLILFQVNTINEELGIEPKALVEVSGASRKDQFSMGKLLKYAEKGRETIDGNEADDDEYEVRPILEAIYGEQALKHAQYFAKQQNVELSLKVVEMFAKDAGLCLIKDPYKEEGLCLNIASALQKIQANHILWGRKEDDFNTALRDLIPDVYEKRDQTLIGEGKDKKAAGELDLELLNKSSQKLALVEALRLTGVEKDDIKLHVDKALDNYNPNGLPFAFIVMYCEAANFEGFWDRLKDHMTDYAFKAPLEVVDSDEKIKEIDEPYTELRHAKMILKRSGKAFSLHIYAISMK